MFFLSSVRMHGSLAAAVGLAVTGSALAQNHVEPSLKTIQVPEPSTLNEYVADRAAAIRLGKALYWDVRVGSDGQTACATCHHQAGADSRTTSIFHPGADGTFSNGIAPGARPVASLYPLTKFSNPADRNSTKMRSINDVAGSPGVMRENFGGLNGLGGEICNEVTEPVFIAADGTVQRQVTGRNAPSVINAVFNIRQFWDGRANAWFNGVNPFGAVDSDARVWKYDAASGSASQVQILLDHASLASQAVGPVGSDVEMAAHGRSWTDVAKKILNTRGLATQKIAANDSVLGAFASPAGGVSATYNEMIQSAFLPNWWSDTEVAPGMTMTQANMALYFGLAVQMYEATLVSDDSRYDQFIEQDGVMGGAPGLLTDQELKGMRLFFNMDPSLPRTNCQLCHMSALFSGATYEVEGAGGPDVPGIGLFPGAADSDNDGVPDVADAFPHNAKDWLDSDHDGVGDNADSDDDNDGIADVDDPAPLDPLNVPAGDPKVPGIYPPSPILEEHGIDAVLGSTLTFREPPTGFEPSVRPLNFTIRGKGIDLVDAKGTTIAHYNTLPRRAYAANLDSNTVIPVPSVGEFSAFIVDVKIVNGQMTLELGVEDFPIGVSYAVKIDGVVRGTVHESDRVLFEAGFDNIGIRPTSEDLGLGGSHPNGVPLSPAKRLQTNGNLVEYGDLSASMGITPRVDGAFKEPTLRNVELTGPYFHNGGMATLEDCIRFYNRGGDFHDANTADLAGDMRAMNLSEDHIAALAAFLRTLTDERVRNEAAPFDHPSLPLPDGTPLAAVGADGRAATCGKPMATFIENLLAADPWAGDCNQNGQLDECEITVDPTLDRNHNGVLDTCEHLCPGDVTSNGVVNGEDLGIVLAAWGTVSPNADIDGDGVVGGGDLALLLGSWGTCP